jgi:PAS domain S-box-containing protein
MSDVTPPAYLRYGVALLATGLGMLARVPIQPILEDAAPYVTFYLAILVGSSFGGLGPGLLATGLSALVVAGAPAELLGSFDLARPGDRVGLIVLVAVGALTSLLGEGLHRARRHALATHLRLRESEDRYQTTLASIGDAVIATDLQGRVTFLNAAARTLTGWGEDALGRPLRDVFVLVHEDTHQRIEGPATLVLRDGTVLSAAHRALLVARDGREACVSDSTAPVRDQRGRTHGVVVVFRDVTEKRRAEAERERLQAELRRRNEQLQELDRRKDDFLALLGHELRNPLAPLRYAVHLLAHAPDNQAVVTQARETIGRQVAQMTRLVDELLEASRIARGKVELRRGRIDLAAVVAATAEDHRPELTSAGLSLTVQRPPGEVWIDGDAARLTQVVGNLLNNAAKFTPRGGQVAVRVREEGATALLTVQDSGIGIAPEALAWLFEPFSQVEAGLERSKGGLGLGLSVVRGLVELHGGRVQAGSEGPGRGTVISVWLPLASFGNRETGRQGDREAEEEVPANVSPSPCLPVSPSGSRRVLIVEDNRDAADSLALVLSMAGFEVKVAYSGPEGVRLAGKLLPYAVVCDLGLPGMTGFEVARVLRADPRTAGALLVCVTGYGQVSDRRQAREAGFDEALVKPVEPEALLRLLG